MLVGPSRGVVALAAAAESHPDDASITAAGLLCLLHALAAAAAGAEAAARLALDAANTAGLVVQLMAAHRGCGAVQEGGCRVLALCTHSDKALAAGAAEALVRAVQDPGAGAAGVAAGCRGLHALAVAEAVPLARKPGILRAGAVQACKEAGRGARGPRVRAAATAAGDALVLLHKLTRHIKQHDVRGFFVVCMLGKGAKKYFVQKQSAISFILNHCFLP